MGRPKGSSAGPGRPRATADTRLQYGRTSISFNLSELRVLNRTLRSPWWRSQLRLSGCCKCPVRGPRCLQVHHLMHFLASGNLDELLVALHHRLTALAGQLSAATAAAASAVSGVACGIGPGGGGGEVGADCDMCDPGECFDALHGGSLSSSNTPGPAVGKIITVGHHQQRQQVGAAGASSCSKQRGRDQRGREQPAGQLEGGCGGGVVGLRRVAAEVCGALEELASQLPRGVLPLCPSDDLDFAQHKARGGADNREQQQQPVGAGPAPCGCGPAAPAPAATHGPAHVPAPPEGEAVEVKPELHHEQDMEPPHHHHHHHHHPYQQAVIPCHMHPQHPSYQQQQQQQQHAPLQPPGQYGCAHHTITTEQLEPGQQQQQQAQYRAAGCTYHHPAFYPDIEQQQQQRQQQHMDCTPHATAQAQVAQQPAGASPPTASASQCDSTAAATPPTLLHLTRRHLRAAAPVGPPGRPPTCPPSHPQWWSWPLSLPLQPRPRPLPHTSSPLLHSPQLPPGCGAPSTSRPAPTRRRTHSPPRQPSTMPIWEPQLATSSTSSTRSSTPRTAGARSNPACMPTAAPSPTPPLATRLCTLRPPTSSPARSQPPGQPHPYSGPPPPLLPPQPHPQPSPMLQHLRAQSPPPPPLLPPPSSPPPHLLHACSMSAPAHTAPTTALRATATHVLQTPPPHAASAAVVGHPVHPQPQPLPQQHQQHQHQQPQHQALDPSAAAAVAFYYELRASSPPLECMDVAGQQQQQQQQQHHQPPPSFAAAPYSNPYAIRPTAHAGIEVDAPPPPQQQQQQHAGCVSGEAWPQEVMVWQAHVARVYEPGAEQVPTASAYVCAEPARLVAARVVD